MPHRIILIIALLFLAADIALTTSASARGSGPITTNSQSYQRRLDESRKQLGVDPVAQPTQPYTAPPAVYPRRPVKRQQKPRR